MTYDAGSGIGPVQFFEQDAHREFLRLGAGVGGLAADVQPALVADADSERPLQDTWTGARDYLNDRKVTTLWFPEILHDQCHLLRRVRLGLDLGIVVGQIVLKQSL